MRRRLNLLGLPLRDCEGRDVGRVVGTWPDDGSWEVELVVVRLPRWEGRRMLPADDLSVAGGTVLTPYRRVQVQDAPEVSGRDDADRARAYWMFEDPGIVTRAWRRRSGSFATGRPSPTSPSPTPSAS